MVGFDDSVVEEFVAQGRDARGEQAVELIARATSAPKLYVFGELLDLDGVKELESTPAAPHVALLRVFAYGTLPEYRQHASTLPPLSPAQLLKLRQLTVVQMADASVSMPYDELMAALEMSSVRELEDMLINECIAPGLVRGKLDQRRRAFEVHSCPVGRDLKPGQLGAIIAGLAAWHDNSKDVLAKLGDQMTWTTEEADRRKEHRKEVDDAVNALRKEMKVPSSSQGAGAGAGGAEGGATGGEEGGDGDGDADGEEGAEGLDLMDEDTPGTGIGSKRRR